MSCGRYGRSHRRNRSVLRGSAPSSSFGFQIVIFRLLVFSLSAGLYHFHFWPGARGMLRREPGSSSGRNLIRCWGKRGGWPPIGRQRSFHFFFICFFLHRALSIQGMLKTELAALRIGLFRFRCDPARRGTIATGLRDGWLRLLLLRLSLPGQGVDTCVSCVREKTDHAVVTIQVTAKPRVSVALYLVPESKAAGFRSLFAQLLSVALIPFAASRRLSPIRRYCASGLFQVSNLPVPRRALFRAAAFVHLAPTEGRIMSIYHQFPLSLAAHLLLTGARLCLACRYSVSPRVHVQLQRPPNPPPASPITPARCIHRCTYPCRASARLRHGPHRGRLIRQRSKKLHLHRARKTSGTRRNRSCCNKKFDQWRGQPLCARWCGFRPTQPLYRLRR